MRPVANYTKDPSAVLDYGIDWSDWLESGESIATSTWTVTPSGLTVDSETEDADSTLIWLSGGTAGVSYDVTNKIVTDNATPRTDERTIRIHVKER